MTHIKCKPPNRWLLRLWWRTLASWWVPVVFGGLLSLPLLWFDRPSFVPAAQENRTPQPFPRFSLSWFQNFEKWFGDRYGMRDALIHYGSRMQMARTGRPANLQVVVGKEGWLFLDPNFVVGRPHFADMYGKDPLSSVEIQAVVDNFTHAQRALSNCGIALYFVLAPDKNTIYPDKLDLPPPGAATTGADQIVKALREQVPGLGLVDLRPELISARHKVSMDLYHRTDTHWNAMGAYWGYRALVQSWVDRRMLTWHPDLHDLDRYQVRRQRYAGGDIAVNLLDLPNYFEDYVVDMNPVVERRAMATQPSKETQVLDARVLQFENPKSAAPIRALLYRDSFSEALLPYLAEDFRRLHAAYGHAVDGRLVREVQPDMVVIELIERNLRGLTQPNRDLDQACRQP